MAESKHSISKTPESTGAVRVLLASFLCTFLHGAFFYYLVREQLVLMRQKQAALESIKMVAVPGSAFLDNLGWSAPLYASLFYLVLLGMMFLGFLFLSLFFASPLMRAIFLSLGLLTLASFTMGDRVWGSFVIVVILSFGSFYLLTLQSRIHFARAEISAFLLVALVISLSLFFGSKQKFFLKARDRVLFGNSLGNGVVSFYYQYSPLAAALITPEKGIYQGLLFDKEIKDGNAYYMGKGIFATGNPTARGGADFEISRNGNTALLTSRFGQKLELTSSAPQDFEKAITSLFGMKGFAALNSIGLYAFPATLMVLISLGIRSFTRDRRAFAASIGFIGLLIASSIWVVSLTGNRPPDQGKLESIDISKQGLSVAHFLYKKHEVPSPYSPAVTKMVKSESPVLRYWGVYLLGIGGNREDAVKVKPLLEDPVPNVRYTAARTLYRLVKNESLNSLVVRLVSDPSWYVRCKVYSLFLEAGVIPSPA